MLRNAILIALAMDATPQEIEHAHDIIDRVYGASGNAGVDPQYAVVGLAPATDANGTTAHGQTVVQHTATTTTPPAVEYDKTGLPYDERIHSSSKENKLNADGTWRAKRGVDKKYAAQIEAQLRATVTAPTPVSTPAAPVTAVQQPPQPGAGGPLMPGGNLPPMPGTAAVDPGYATLVQFIAANTKSAVNPGAKFDDQYIKDVLTHYGVAEGSVQNLAHRLDLVPQVDAWLRQVLATA